MVALIVDDHDDEMTVIASPAEHSLEYAWLRTPKSELDAMMAYLVVNGFVPMGDLPPYMTWPQRDEAQQKTHYYYNHVALNA